MLVVDASVAVKWFVPEAGSAEAERLAAEETLHAPSLLRVEVGNAFRTLAARGSLSEPDAAEAMALLLAAPVALHEPSDGLMAAALDLALLLGHPIYDCLYLALALDLGGPLVTADARFHRAASSSPDLRGIVRLL